MYSTKADTISHVTVSLAGEGNKVHTVVLVQYSRVLMMGSVNGIIFLCDTVQYDHTTLLLLEERKYQTIE
jgi:hypothetical protein